MELRACERKLSLGDRAENDADALGSIRVFAGETANRGLVSSPAPCANNL